MSEISKQALKVENNTNFPNNNTGYITPSLLREFNSDFIDSTVNQTSYNVFTASVTSSIQQLSAFTASQQPTFNALNSFTASQLTINSGVNAFTYSADARLDATESDITDLQTWSGSVNQIIFNGVSAGYSTRFNFGGFLSASLVQNVNGTIADINYLQDPTKLNTSSFNDYTASTAASQSVFSASVASTFATNISKFNQYTASTNAWTASTQTSLDNLLNFSSSLSGGFATQGELDAVQTSLQNQIDTKLNTASFNTYTQSFSQSVATDFSESYHYVNQISFTLGQDITNLSSSVSTSITLLSASIEDTDTLQTQRINTLSSFTGSYATTGSNNFIGTLTLTGSAYGNVISASIVSNTASLDLSQANYFTLTLAPNASTQIKLDNVQPGVTATLVINTNSTSSVTFSGNVKQPSGSIYVPSISGNVDILSFTAVTPTTAYVVPAFTFV